MRNSSQLRITEASSGAQPSVPRVCLLTETFYPVVGGGETHARLLAGQLTSMGMRTFVITRRSDRALKRSEHVDNVQTYRLPPCGMKRFGKYLMAPLAFVELLRKRREFDIVLVCGYRVLGLPAVIAARMLHKTCVLRSEGMGEMSGEYASAYRRLPPVLGTVFNTWVGIRNRILQNADAFIGISKAVASEFVECGIDPPKIHRITNGIDTKLFRPVDSREKTSIRGKLGISLDKLVVVYSGKLNQGKGLEYLLQAWERLTDGLDGLHLVLVGSGGGQSLSCEDKLRAFVSERKMDATVTFTGYAENVHEYLQAADLFVLPSENESLSISTIEALACGIPAVACRVGGLPDVIQHMKNGLLVEPGDPSALITAINMVIRNQELARSLAAEAHDTACRRFSIDVVSERYYDLFASLNAKKVEERLLSGSEAF